MQQYNCYCCFACLPSGRPLLSLCCNDRPRVNKQVCFTCCMLSECFWTFRRVKSLWTSLLQVIFFPMLLTFLSCFCAGDTRDSPRRLREQPFSTGVSVFPLCSVSPYNRPQQTLRAIPANPALRTCRATAHAVPLLTVMRQTYGTGLASMARSIVCYLS